MNLKISLSANTHDESEKKRQKGWESYCLKEKVMNYLGDFKSWVLKQVKFNGVMSPTISTTS